MTLRRARTQLTTRIEPPGSYVSPKGKRSKESRDETYEWLEYLVRGSGYVPLANFAPLLRTAMRSIEELKPGVSTVGQLQDLVRPVVELVESSLVEPFWDEQEHIE